MKLNNKLYVYLHSVVFDCMKYSVEDYESLCGLEDRCVDALSGVPSCISVLKVMEDAKVEFGQVYTFELSDELREFVGRLLKMKLIDLSYRVRNLCDGVGRDKLADQLDDLADLLSELYR